MESAETAITHDNDVIAGNYRLTDVLDQRRQIAVKAVLLATRGICHSPWLITRFEPIDLISLSGGGDQSIGVVSVLHSVRPQLDHRMNTPRLKFSPQTIKSCRDCSRVMRKIIVDGDIVHNTDHIHTPCHASKAGQSETSIG